MSKFIYDDKHKAISYTKSDKGVSLKKTQGGWKGEFFCEQCEKETSKHDHFGATLFDPESKHLRPKNIKFKAMNIPGPEGALMDAIKWENINFLKLQKFVYSIVLREHLDRTSKKEKNLLEIKDFEKMRSLYRGNRYDDITYPIIILKQPYEEIKK